MKAFPLSKENNYGQDGMDLRDYFAAQAMQGIIMDGSLNSVTYMEKKDITKEISLLAYGFADAMMEARKI
jgi:hypothetical protein